MSQLGKAVVVSQQERLAALLRSSSKPRISKAYLGVRKKQASVVVVRIVIYATTKLYRHDSSRLRTEPRSVLQARVRLASRSCQHMAPMSCCALPVASLCRFQRPCMLPVGPFQAPLLSQAFKSKCPEHKIPGFLAASTTSMQGAGALSDQRVRLTLRRRSLEPSPQRVCLDAGGSRAPSAYTRGEMDL